MATVWVSWTIPGPNFPHSAFSARVVGETGNLDLDAYGNSASAAKADGRSSPSRRLST